MCAVITDAIFLMYLLLYAVHVIPCMCDKEMFTKYCY